jgi:hypothetical protein
LQKEQQALDSPLARSESRHKEFFTNVYKAVCIICSGIILTISSYGLVASIAGHSDVVGSTFVNVEIPPIWVSPITAKPISILVIAALGLTYSGLELARPYMLRFSKIRISILKGLTFVAGALIAYEVMYNFTIWASQLTLSSLLGYLNPDTIVNQFPNPNSPWNLVFATKLTELGLAVALYLFYYFITIERAKEKQKDRLLREERRQEKITSSLDFIER